MMCFRSVLPIAAAVMSVVPAARGYDPTRDPNHFGVRAKFGFNLRTDFSASGAASASGLPLGPAAGGGVDRVYADGFVKNDAANGGLGQSWNWGYQNGAQYDAAGNGGQGTIAMHSTSSVAGGSGDGGGGSSKDGLGWEISYGRDLGYLGAGWWGVEGAIGILSISNDRDFGNHGTVSRITDLFNLGGSVPTSAPYVGSYNGPGVTLDTVPLSRTSVDTPGDTYGRDSFSTTVVSFRFGPYLEIPIAKAWTISLSGGPAFAFFDGSYSYQQRTTDDGGLTYSPGSGSGSGSGLLAGVYVDGRVHYGFSDRWTVFGGVQYNYLSAGRVSGGERAARLKLGAGIFVELGVGFSY